MPDIIEASNLGSSVLKSYINNGSGWTENNTFAPTIYFTTSSKVDNGVRFSDINGDGLVDMLEDYENGTTTNRSAWLNTGNRWRLNTSWQSPEPFTSNGKNNGRRIADVNGDGIGDIIVTIGNTSVEYGHTYIKNYTNAYLWHVKYSL